MSENDKRNRLLEIREVLRLRWFAQYLLYDYNIWHAESRWLTATCDISRRSEKILADAKAGGISMDPDEAYNRAIVANTESWIREHQRVCGCTREDIEYDIAEQLEELYSAD